jgi:hypothetical protein
MIRLHFCTTNNVVEYEALINGLCIAAELRFSGFTFVMILSLSSTKSWGSRTATTPTWWNIDKRSGSWRRSLMVWSFIISSGETMRQLTPRLGRVKSQPPPPGVFTQDLFKPSIWLEEDGPTPMPGIPPGECSPTPTPGTLPGKGGVPSASEVDPGPRSSQLVRAGSPRHK